MISGLAVIVVAFICCLLLSLWGKHESTPRLAPEPAPPTQIGLENFPDQVRPSEILDLAQSVTVRDRFQGFVATEVRPDGSVDLGYKNAQIRFSFQSPSGIGPQPLRQGGTLPSRRYCGLQSVFVNSSGLFAVQDDPDRPCPSAPPESLEAPPAKCSLEDVWKVARKRNIKAKGRATIEYFQTPGGPAYQFKLSKDAFVVSAKDCRTILKGRAAHGFVP